LRVLRLCQSVYRTGQRPVSPRRAHGPQHALAVFALFAPSAAAFGLGVTPAQQQRSAVRVAGPPLMLNLFGNNAESKERREMLSARDARAGDRKVTFRKPNMATDGLVLGLKFKEGFGKAVYIEKILPNTEAARLEQQGKIKKGDQITMVSATFGDEMWSARGIGKYRLEKSIAVRQGNGISFVLENSDDGSKKEMERLAKLQKAENDKISRLQKQMAGEVDAGKAQQKKLFGLF